MEKILSVVAKSMSLQEVHLSSAGLRWDFFQKLAASMASNSFCNLTTLDISLNFVEDRGLAAVSSVLSHFPRGPRHLNLAHCSLTGKSVNSLASALVTNKARTRYHTAGKQCFGRFGLIPRVQLCATV